MRIIVVPATHGPKSEDPTFDLVAPSVFI